MIRKFLTILIIIGCLSFPGLSFAWECVATSHSQGGQWYGKSSWLMYARVQAVDACYTASKGTFEPKTCYVIVCSETGLRNSTHRQANYHQRGWGRYDGAKELGLQK